MVEGLKPKFGKVARMMLVGGLVMSMMSCSAIVDGLLGRDDDDDDWDSAYSEREKRKKKKYWARQKEYKRLTGEYYSD